MRIAIEHRTHFRYSGEVTHAIQYLRLTPYTNTSQHIVAWRIDAPGQLTPWTDGYGNSCHTLVMERPGAEIEIVTAGQVDTTDTSGVLPPAAGDPPLETFLRPTALTRADAALCDLAAGCAEAVRRDRIEGLHALMGAIRERVDYRTGVTAVHSTAAEALADGAGVCQDHAHVFIACCRALAVPARYVSGYLCTGEADALHPASHAWAAAWVDDLGWVSFDVANTVCGTERHVGLAAALDYAGAAPVRGVRDQGAGEEELVVAVRIVDAAQ